MFSSVIVKKPIFTEKSERKRNAENVYTFKVSKNSNKNEIKKFIENFYKVKVDKVRIINIHPKLVLRGTKIGKKAGFKKALVTLKKGQKIENY